MVNEILDRGNYGHNIIATLLEQTQNQREGLSAAC